MRPSLARCPETGVVLNPITETSDRSSRDVESRTCPHVLRVLGPVAPGAARACADPSPRVWSLRAEAGAQAPRRFGLQLRPRAPQPQRVAPEVPRRAYAAAALRPTSERPS